MFDRKEYMKEYRKKYNIENREEIRKKKKRYYLDNSERIKEKSRQYRKDNPKKKKKSDRRWKKNNPEKVKKQDIIYRQNNKEKELERQSIYRKNNKEKVKIARRKYANRRMKIDLRFRLNHRMRSGIALSLKNNKNGRHWEDLIDYTLNDLIKRLKNTMPKGYSWQNFLKGQLHIEHIIPIRAFIFKTPEDEDFKQCWSLYNLRLLPAKENKIKKDNITNPILLELLLEEK